MATPHPSQETTFTPPPGFRVVDEDFTPPPGFRVVDEEEIKAPSGFREVVETDRELDVLGGFAEIGRAIAKTPQQIKSSLISALRSGDINVAGPARELVNASKEEQEAFIAGADPNKEIFPGITFKDIRSIPQSLAATVLSAGAGLTTGVAAAAAGTLATPGVGTAAGFGAGGLASGAVAFRVSKDQFMQNILDILDDQSKETNGRGITQEEWDTISQKFEDKGTAFGLYEAIPEAIGQALTLGIVRLPFGKLAKIPKVKSAIGKAVKKLGIGAGKFAGIQVEEQLGETITGLGQGEIEAQVGLREKTPTITEAFKEQAPQTALISTLLGGGALVGSKVYDSSTGNFRPPTEAEAKVQKEGIEKQVTENLTTEELINNAPEFEEAGISLETVLANKVEKDTETPEAIIDENAQVFEDISDGKEIAELDVTDPVERRTKPRLESEQDLEGATQRLEILEDEFNTAVEEIKAIPVREIVDGVERTPPKREDLRARQVRLREDIENTKATIATAQEEIGVEPVVAPEVKPIEVVQPKAEEIVEPEPIAPPEFTIDSINDDTQIERPIVIDGKQTFNEDKTVATEPVSAKEAFQQVKTRKNALSELAKCLGV